MKTSTKLGERPIGRLLFTMSIPAIFSMLVQALYNIIDSYFVSKIGSEALNSVSLSFPLQMIVTAVAIGLGIGVNSLISRKKGAGEDEEANQAAKTSILLAIILGIVFVVLGLTIPRLFLSSMTDNETVVELGTGYLTIILSLSFFVIMEITLTRILQAVGNMIIPMLCQLLGAITNIILDPILIFNAGMGVRGAAAATIIGQGLALVLAISVFIFRKQEINISLRNFKFKLEHVKGILVVGLPVTIMNSIGSITTMTMNTVLNNYHLTLDDAEAAVNVLGVYFRLQSFVFMPIFGLTQGGMPILGYNYKANKKKRYVKTVKYILITSLIIFGVGFVVFQTIPHLLLSIFHPTELMMSIGVRALRIISLCFIPVGFGIVFANVFQSLGHGFKSLAMTLFRQLIVLIPTALILTIYTGVNNIWYAYGIAELMATLVFTPIAIYTINKQFRIRDYQLSSLKELAS